jgi:cbb3-type cytochrome oxidase subunit 3
MSLASIAGIVTTVVSFVVFVGIAVWAWSSRPRAAFAEAAHAPFALPDERAGGERADARGDQECRS